MFYKEYCTLIENSKTVPDPMKAAREIIKKLQGVSTEW